MVAPSAFKISFPQPPGSSTNLVLGLALVHAHLVLLEALQGEGVPVVHGGVGLLRHVLVVLEPPGTHSIG